MTFLALVFLSGFLALVLAHKMAAGIAAWVFFAAVVDGMPAPSATSGVAYKWLHASLNLLAGNVFRVLSAISPRFAAIFPANQPASKE